MCSVRIPLHSRKYPNLFALVDEDDVGLVVPYRWNVKAAPNDIFYAVANAPLSRREREGDKRQALMHRLINKTPEWLDTDHINGDGLDNRKANLRSCHRAQNVANAHTPIRNRLGYLGVVDMNVRKRARPFQAVVRRAVIGSYETAEEAARIVDMYRRTIYGEHVRLNFPDERPEIGVMPSRQFEQSSCYRGVSAGPNGMWRAFISVNGKRVQVGTYGTEREAAWGYDYLAKQVFGIKARLNFPDDS